MSLRFRRSIRIAPGLRLNLGMRGLGLSAGLRGAGLTIGTSGLTGHVGVPGTGLSLRQRLDPGQRSLLALPSHAIPTGAKALGGGLHSLSITLSLDERGRLVLTGPDGTALDPRIERRARREKETELRSWLSEQCRLIGQGVEDLLALHLRTPSPDQPHRYCAVLFPEPIPEPIPPLRIGFFDRLIPGLKNRRVSEHERAVELREGETTAWKSAKEIHEREQERLRRRYEDLRLTDVPTMMEFLDETMNSIPWPRETNIGFELKDGGNILYLDVDLPEVEDMPQRSAELAARGLKLNIRERSELEIRKLYMMHVHAVIFRVVGESLATLPSIVEVVCSGYSQRADPATGAERDDYLLSVRVRREDWRRINFLALEQLDPIACLGTFDLRRDTTKSAIFEPIEPFGPGAHDKEIPVSGA